MSGIETLIGRDRELAVVDAALRRLDQERNGRAVWVEGDAGVGKSAVVAVLASLTSGVPVTVGSFDAGSAPLGTLARLLNCPLGPDTPAAEAADRLGTAMAAACAAGPVVLVAEDLHRADEASLLAWSQLSRMAHQLPVLLVGTCSPRPYRERLSQLRDSVRRHGGEMLSLGPLSDADVIALAERRLGGTPGPRLVRWLKAIRGNPGAAVGMLSELDADGLFDRTADRVELRRGTPDPALILEAHACRGLSPGEHGIVRAAALAPVRFDAADVANALDASLPTVVTALSNATDLGILRAEGDHLTFRHEVVRDACVRTLPPAERRTMHRAAATRLLVAGARPQTVAHHVRAAGELPPEAMQWRARLTEPTLLSDPSLFSGVLHMAPPDFRSAAIDYWRGDYDAVLRTAAKWTDSLRTEARSDNGELKRLSLRALIGARRLDAAIAVCEGTSDPHLQAWRAIALAASGDVTAARAGIDGLDHHQATAMATAALAHALVRVGRGVRAGLDLATVRDALTDDTAEARELRLLLHGDLLELLPQTGPPAAVARVLAETPAFLADADSELHDRVQSAAGWAAYATGQWDTASVLDPRLAAAVAARRSRRPGTPGARTAALTHWEPSAIQAEAAGRLEEALALRREGFAEALGSRPSRLHGAEHIVRLCLATGADASDIIEGCERVADDEGLPVQIAVAALVRAIVGRDADGLSAAAEQLAGHGAVSQHAFALEEAAVCLAEAGDRRTAGRTLHQAVQVYTSLGAAWDIARADTRLHPHGIRRRVPANQPTSGWAALTPAEFRVVRLVARGLSNRAIAEELFLSENTVRTHLARIRDKLGLRSRLAIARAAGFRADAPGPRRTPGPGSESP